MYFKVQLHKAPVGDVDLLRKLNSFVSFVGHFLAWLIALNQCQMWWTGEVYVDGNQLKAPGMLDLVGDVYSTPEVWAGRKYSLL